MLHRSLYVGGYVDDVEFSPVQAANGATLIAVACGGNTLICDDRAESILHTFPENRCIRVAFSPNGNLLATGSSTGKVDLWSTETMQKTQTSYLFGNRVNSLVFSPDGTMLAASFDLDVVVMWNIHMFPTVSRTFFASDGGYFVYSISFSSNGLLFAASKHQAVHIWESRNGKLLESLKHGVNSIAFSPVAGSNILALGGVSIYIYDVRDMCVLLHELCDHESRHITGLKFSYDGTRLYATSSQYKMCLWNVATGKKLPINAPTYAEGRFSLHPNGRQIATHMAPGTCLTDNLRGYVCVWALCKWSDTRHRFFGPEMKRIVFCLMCVRHRLSASIELKILPIELWLSIFLFVSCT
jgi:WD40 repeat protein